MERTLKGARSLGHQFTLAETLLIAARLWHYMRDVGAVRRAATEALDISIKHGFPLFIADATVWSGWADATERSDRSATNRLREGLETFRAIGAQVFLPHHLVLLGEALSATGDSVGALNALAEARERSTLHGNLDHGVEALRVHARVIAGSHPQHPEVARLLDEASDLARRQGALSLGLRVAVSQLRLVMDGGEPKTIKRAYARLAAVCDELPRGAHSPEFDDARALVSGVSVLSDDDLETKGVS